MRIEQITFTRFIAAISIVIYHFGKNIFPFDNKLISFLFKQANIGVSYFFILSGFIMIIAYQSKSKINILDYFKNRFARIYPVYFIALILLFVGRFIVGDFIDYSGFILNVFVVQAWVPGMALAFNPPAWSLSVELLFYAIFPFLFNSFYSKINNYKKYIFPIFLFFLVSQFILHYFFYSGFYKGPKTFSHDLLFYFPLMHLNAFLIGNITGLFFVKKVKQGLQNFDLHILIIITLIILALKNPCGLIYNNGLFSILFVPLILLICLNNGLISFIFKAKILVFLGEISFGIYILQIPVFNFSKVFLKFVGIKDHMQFFYFSLVILVLVSAISYVIIETPLRNKINRLRFNKRK